MARLIQPLQRRNLFQTKTHLQFLRFQPKTPIPISYCSNFLSPPIQSTTLGQIRNNSYVTEMRRSAFEGNMLRLLRNEIQYELDRSPLTQPAAQINGFKVDERPGKQWISLEKQFEQKEKIKVEVTMFDGSVPVPKAGEKKGALGQEVQLHITLIISIFKEETNQVLELICSAWPDSVEIQKFYVRERAKKPHKPYTGPQFRELDDELQDSLYEFLEERGVDDSLCVFLHKYMNYKDKAEYIHWMGSVKSLIDKGE